MEVPNKLGLVIDIKRSCFTVKRHEKLIEGRICWGLIDEGVVIADQTETCLHADCCVYRIGEIQHERFVGLKCRVTWHYHLNGSRRVVSWAPAQRPACRRIV